MIMSKAVLMSIQPKWCELIASGKKTVEIRKTKPKLETPFKVYIYCTKPKHYYRVSGCITASDECLWLSNGEVKMGDGFEYWVENKDYCSLNGKVIGEFVCNEIEWFMPDYTADWSHGLYACHISNLVIYDKPKELSEFYTKCNIPESKCKFCDNCYDREDYYGRHYAVKKLTRPPQSWCYVEDGERN